MPAGIMFAKIAVSVAVAFLGAYPLASSSGLLGSPLISNESQRREFQQQELIFGSGFILFFLFLALIGPTLRLIRQILDTLAKVEERPRPAVAVTMFVLGTVCAIAAMLIQLNAGSHPPASVSMNIPGFNSSPPSMAVQSSGSLALSILTFLTFLLGASLIGLGIWASLKPSAKAIAPWIKPEAREFAEVATG
jgi:hypothetical protein